MLPDEVLEKLAALPPEPGVYLFKDKKGEIVYVGKAKSLRSRVRSYFQAGGSDNRYFIPILQKTIGDLETIVTSSEKEATILENNLIKQNHPRYNIKLRDDKEYLSLRLGTDHPWPRLTVVRRPANDGARYFGPYHSATAARRTLHLINKHFQLRTCGDLELQSRRRPCLQHQIKRCPAPCVYEVDPAWYADQARAVAMFIEGRHDELSRELDDKMRDSARKTRFELAAVYRDQLRALEKVRESQRVVSTEDRDQDVVGLFRDGDLAEIALLYVRAGRLADVTTFSIKQAEVPDEEVISAFLAQHYGDPLGVGGVRAEGGEGDGGGDATDDAERGLAVPIPDEIILPALPEVEGGIAEWLSDRAGHKVSLLHPKRGARVALLELANDNARHAFLEKRRTSDDVHERLAQLQERLRLPSLPRRIECCDISHLGGGDTVGAIVAMKDGLPDKKRYRTFHVKGTSGEIGVGDDYGAMYEVLARRFRRGIRASRDAEAAEASSVLMAAEDTIDGAADATGLPGDADAERPDNAASVSDDPEWDLPDLFVVDGGRGQLAVALAASRDLGLHTLPIVALAKEKETALGAEVVDRVYLPGQKNPIALKTHSASLFFLARVRDEAHRFSNRAREKLGKTRRFRSALDDVRGIGAPTKKSLFQHLGSLDGIQNAEDVALLAVPGVTARHVRALRAAFGPPRVHEPASPPSEPPPPAISPAPPPESPPLSSPPSAHPTPPPEER